MSAGVSTAGGPLRRPRLTLRLPTRSARGVTGRRSGPACYGCGRRTRRPPPTRWGPFYVQGISLGVALPGRFPSDFPTDDSTYGRWLELIAGARANAVRVYTILPPAFYRSLKAWNDSHPDRALWLLHGVWTELPPGDDYDAVNWKAAFRADMRRVV